VLRKPSILNQGKHVGAIQRNVLHQFGCQKSKHKQCHAMELVLVLEILQEDMHRLLLLIQEEEQYHRSDKLHRRDLPIEEYPDGMPDT